MFREAQRLPLRRTAIVLAIPPLGILFLLIWQVVLGHPWGKQPMSNGNIIGWTIFLWLVYVRLLTIRLITEVRAKELRIAMRGLWRSERIPLDRIRSIEVMDHDPARDFGGYGIRTTRRGKAYIANGSGGVRITLASGEKLVVGSNKADQLATALRSLKSE